MSKGQHVSEGHGSRCTACGMVTSHPAEYHPFIFCELFKLGHTDPAAYLRLALPGAIVVLPTDVRSVDPAETHEVVPRPDASRVAGSPSAETERRTS